MHRQRKTDMNSSLELVMLGESELFGLSPAVTAQCSCGLQWLRALHICPRKDARLYRLLIAFAASWDISLIELN